MRMIECCQALQQQRDKANKTVSIYFFEGIVQPADLQLQ